MSPPGKYSALSVEVIPMSSIMLSIHRNEPIICPICLRPLIGPACWVLGGVVFCRLCAWSTADSIIHRICRRSQYERWSRFFVDFSGLRACVQLRSCGPTELKLMQSVLGEDPDPAPFMYHCHRPIPIPSDLDYARPPCRDDGLQPGSDPGLHPSHDLHNTHYDHPDSSTG